MPDVWTHCKAGSNTNLEGVVERPSGRWAHAKNFETKQELHDWLASLGINGRIGTLVINSHGDFGGRLLLDETLTHRSNEQLFADWFGPLRRYITPTGHLWFTGCALADRTEGTRLLQRISYQLPHRVIIGHDRQSYNPTTGLGYDPGNIVIRDLFEMTHASQADQLQQRVNKLHPATKWVSNQRVLRYPRNEQENRDQMCCAYPLCPGHDEPTHQCDGGWDPGCQWRGSSRIPDLPVSPSPHTFEQPYNPTMLLSPTRRGVLSPSVNAGRERLNAGSSGSQGRGGVIWR